MDKIKDFEINSPRWLSLEDFEGEEWKPVKGFEGLYEVSNYGRIKFLSRSGRTDFIKRIISSKTRCNYWRVSIYHNGICKQYAVHRLVAIAFIPNPNNLPQVNHKDENKLNPIASNLEWCDQKYNSRYGTMPERMRRHMIRRRNEGYNIPKVVGGRGGIGGRKPITIYQYRTDGEYISSYKSQKEACKANNISTSNINDALKGRVGTAGGFVWSYTKDKEEIEKRLKRVKGKPRKRVTIPVAQYTLNGDYICTYPSALSAAKANNLYYGCILKCAKGKFHQYKGFRWKFV